MGPFIDASHEHIEKGFVDCSLKELFETRIVQRFDTFFFGIN